ncbi:MAG: hypothetical protein QXW47_03555 [Candidatus Jordarchaeales archaeon]
MSASKSLLFLLAALVLSLALSQALLAPQPVLAITGEKPSYTVGDTWKYNLTITNTTDGTTSKLLTLSVSGAGAITSFNGTPIDCYTLKYQPALDPFTLFILYIQLFGGMSINEYIEILENSYSEFYVAKSNNELIGMHIYLYYFDGSSNGVNLSVTFKFNETYPYPLKFPLEINSTFGNYNDEMAYSLQGYILIYNSTTHNWDNVTPPETEPIGWYVFLLFPLVNVTGTENVTVPAGTFECWKMEHPQNPDILKIWYSPEVKSIVRLNFSLEGAVLYEMDLQSYSHALLTPEQQTFLLFYFLQQSSQQFMFFIALGGAAAALGVATIAILAWKKRK